jgi:hypothetical protein
MIGWGSAVSIVLSWVDKLIPSKKKALFDELSKLNKKYQDALNRGDDYDAAVYRKQMVKLRERADATGGDL